VPNTNTQYDQTVDIVRNAIPRMSELKIPITPSNYAVWYEYLSDSNQALRQEMDVLLSRGQPITNGEMKGLYERYLKERNEEQWVAKTALSQMVSTLMSHIENADGHYSGFTSELNDIASSLAGDVSSKELDDLMDRAMRATNTALEQGKDLKQRLSSLATEMEDVRGKLERSQKEARADALTGLHNRLAFQEELAALPRFAVQDSHAPCLLLIDVDFFKRVNDNYGHPVGDHVLRAVAREIKACVRGRDMVARYGGEEFAVLLRDTPRSGCVAVAEHVRAGIERQMIKVPEELLADVLIAVTASVGGAWFREEETPEAFVDRADRALYLSKQEGRNRVTWEGRNTES
jgi:diguanylate cyclase